MLKKLIICGSNSKKSRSVTLAEQLSRELSIWAIYLNVSENIPLLNNDLTAKKEFPPTITFLVEKIREHDAIILVFPQYNYNFSGFLKNVLDWCSLVSRKIFHSKILVLLGVSLTESGSDEFKQVTSFTCNALGADKIVFLNWTPNTRFEELIKNIKRYV
ncbi:NAD(P)H-dependent oxidoreductase [Mycoplasma wenyonii]|uniref:NAD(P)H-dependent oxidoreductase n=1 Tax=Mycoplasma wenyonii TaxID=65123 RepID=A0A328PPY2_9MOLU|nr:NAD(P)H-dependent oxidoreductase [Mycoplasma wenyonii]RAO95216.1 NAD(P)H-dependent oxidoreductase [Mycoplasma wenyonii]